jgi:hypothetical protein
MKGRSFILRCAAFLLILVFSQKAGAGLFLHNFFHANTEQSSSKENKSNEISYACSCIDDFLMPFDEVTEPVCLPVFSNYDPPLTFEDRIPFQTIILSSLRGPPAHTV